MKVGAIVQARYSSTRLPGKVLLPLKGHSVLYHDIQRMKQSKLIDEIIIATSTNPKDDLIVKEAKNIGVDYFRGSEQDVLSRYYFAAEERNYDVIVRMTSDCPLIDPNVVDKVIEAFFENGLEVSTNATLDLEKRTYPRGFDTEVFSFELLLDAHRRACMPYQREHVTPYIYENAKNVTHVMNNKDYSGYRLTLDTLDDYNLIGKIYDDLYHGEHDFYMEEIISLLVTKPDLVMINQHVKQKGI